jgi:ATP-dependent Lon protease
LERIIGKVIPHVAKLVAMEKDYKKTIKPEMLTDILGAEIFDKEIYEDNDSPGVVTGLAWTQVGGEILFIESSLSRGRGKLTLSGQLGDVMKESAMAALSYLRSNALRYNIDYRIFDQYDLHIHVPAGAVPKDGPSAGVTLLTSLASIFTQRKVRAKLAMTGEITLRGKVLPVGGIKEKLLAARRAGIEKIVLCRRNKKEVDEIESQYLKGLDICYVNTVDEVVEKALLEEKVDHPMEFVLFDDKKESTAKKVK